MSHRTVSARQIGLLLCLLLTAYCVLPSAAQAQLLPKLTIDQVRVGFPAGTAGETRFKSGAWAPVYIDVTTSKNWPQAAVLLLTVETADSDNVQNRYVTEVRGLEPEKQTTLLTYVRPGNLSADTVITLRDADRPDRVFDSAKPGRLAQYPLGPETILYLVAGRSRPPKLRQAILQEAGNVAEDEIQDAGSRRIAYADRLEYLPTRWFGYQAVDAMVLTTGSEAFIKELVEEQSHCKEALAEWVRRGGRLVISVGRNHQWVSRLLSQIEQRTGAKLIDCEIQGTVYRRHLVLKGWTQARQAPRFGGD